MDDLTLPELVAEFPGWTVWRGVDQMWYARPPFPRWTVWRGVDLLWYARPANMAAVRGEDLTDLRDQIRRALGTPAMTCPVCENLGIEQEHPDYAGARLGDDWHGQYDPANPQAVYEALAEEPS